MWRLLSKPKQLRTRTCTFGAASTALLSIHSEIAAQHELRSTGQPEALDSTFNLDFGLGTFSCNDSLYTNVRPHPSGDPRVQ